MAVLTNLQRYTAVCTLKRFSILVPRHKHARLDFQAKCLLRLTDLNVYPLKSHIQQAKILTAIKLHLRNSVHNLFCFCFLSFLAENQKWEVFRFYQHLNSPCQRIYYIIRIFLLNLYWNNEILAILSSNIIIIFFIQ